MLFTLAWRNLWRNKNRTLITMASISSAVRTRPFTRERAFPTAFARMTVAGDGTYTSEAWPEDRRDRAWQPSDPARRERGLGWNARREETGDKKTGDAPE